MSDQNATIAECFLNIKSSLAIYQSAMETQQTIGALTKYNHLTVLLGHMGEVVVLFRKFILDERTTGNKRNCSLDSSSSFLISDV